MPSVDDLCRSYLDLKYHFDPAAASSAGLVAHDGRLGSFDVASVREHVSALRSVAGAVEELDVEGLQEEIDRTALLGELRGTIFRFEQQRNTIKALKRDGHECADAERHLRDLLAEEQGLNTTSPKAPDDLQFLPQ